MALFLTTMGSFVPLQMVWFYPLDVLLCIHWDGSGPKCSQRAKVRCNSGEKRWLVLVKGFFPPSLRIGRAEPLAYTVKNYNIPANTNTGSEFPLSQHIRQPPTTWQLPLLPGSCSPKDLRIPSVLLPAWGRITQLWTCWARSLEGSAGGILVSPHLFSSLPSTVGQAAPL